MILSNFPGYEQWTTQRRDKKLYLLNLGNDKGCNLQCIVGKIGSFRRLQIVQTSIKYVKTKEAHLRASNAIRVWVRNYPILHWKYHPVLMGSVSIHVAIGNGARTVAMPIVIGIMIVVPSTPWSITIGVRVTVHCRAWSRLIEPLPLSMYDNYLVNQKITYE